MTGGGPDRGRTEEHGPGTAEASPETDEFHRLLSTARRRRVLYYLRRRSEVSLAELSDVVAGMTAVEEDAVVERRRRDGIRVALHHTDLPMLADGGLLAYDREENAVASSPLPDHLDAILRHSRAYERDRGADRGGADVGR